MDHVDGFVLQQLLVIGVNLGVLGAVLLGGFFRPFGDNVAECHHGGVGLFTQCGEVLAEGDAAAADYSDFQNCVLHNGFPFFLWFFRMLLNIFNNGYKSLR